MALEIERKFLISQIPPAVHACKKIRQAYLQSDPAKSVRVRITEETDSPPVAHLSIKGPAAHGHFTRQEFEYRIPVEEAEAIMCFCDHPPILKTRYLYYHENRLWELDAFQGANAGLLIAEIELEKETAIVNPPAFTLQEVTGDPRYFNLALAYHPFTTW